MRQLQLEIPNSPSFFPRTITFYPHLSPGCQWCPLAVRKEHLSGSHFMLKYQPQWVSLTRNKTMTPPKKKEKEKRAMFDPRVTLMGGLSSACNLSRAPQIRPLLCKNRLILVVGSWRACHQSHLPFPFPCRGLVWGCHLGVKEPSNLLYISLLWNLLVLRGSRPRRRSHSCQGKVLSIGTHASLFCQPFYLLPGTGLFFLRSRSRSQHPFPACPAPQPG